MTQKITRIALIAMLGALLLALNGCASASSIIEDFTQGAYVPEAKQATVASPTIAEDGVLRVGVNSSKAPFSSQASGKLVGIDVDIAAAIADEMGLELELVDVGADGEGALEEGTVDIVMGLDSTDSTATCWLSTPYLPTSVAVFSTDSSATMPVSGIEGLSIEAQTSSTSAWDVSNQFGDSALKSVSDLRTAFSDLDSGSTEYVAADAVVGTYVAHITGSSAQAIGLLQRVGGYSVGAVSSNSELQTAVDNAIDAITTNGVVSVIEQKWLGTTVDLSGLQLSEAAQRATNSADNA